MKKILLIVCLLLVGIGFLVYENTYTYKVDHVDLPVHHEILRLHMAKPEGKVKGVVVMIHGDGALDGTGDGFYKGLWQVITDKGYMAVAWDKPGVGGSTGNWLDQTMHDRAVEALLVIDHLKQEGYDKVYVWGSSQAGWVVPKLAGMIHVDGIILSAPAINWISQGEYSSISNLDDEDEIEQVVKVWRQGIEDLDRGLAYEDYLKTDGDMSQDRFNFVKNNYQVDATEDLKNIETPLLLVLGGQDKHVDSKETRRVYEEVVDSTLLTVEWIPGSNHFMMADIFVDNDLLLGIVYTLMPKRVTSKAYIRAINNFLD